MLESSDFIRQEFAICKSLLAYFFKLAQVKPIKTFLKKESNKMKLSISHTLSKRKVGRPKKGEGFYFRSLCKLIRMPNKSLKILQWGNTETKTRSVSEQTKEVWPTYVVYAIFLLLLSLLLFRLCVYFWFKIRSTALWHLKFQACPLEILMKSRGEKKKKL